MASKVSMELVSKIINAHKVMESHDDDRVGLYYVPTNNVEFIESLADQIDYAYKQGQDWQALYQEIDTTEKKLLSKADRKKLKKKYDKNAEVIAIFDDSDEIRRMLDKLQNSVYNRR